MPRRRIGIVHGAHYVALMLLHYTANIMRFVFFFFSDACNSVRQNFGVRYFGGQPYVWLCVGNCLSERLSVGMPSMSEYCHCLSLARVNKSQRR